jgi:hypothetical protein
MHGQVTAMAQATIATNFSQPLDIHADLTAQIAFNRVPIDSLSQLGHFSF